MAMRRFARLRYHVPMSEAAGRPRRRRGVIVAAAVLLGGAAFALWPDPHAGVNEAAAGRIPIGMTHSQVLSILGWPDLWEPPSSTTRELFPSRGHWYAHSLLGFRHVEVVVAYDERGRVLEAPTVSKHWQWP